MSRKPREQSKSGVYHIMLRGVNQQTVFEDDEDYEKLLQVVHDCKALSGFKLYAYCIMSNHIHLLLRTEVTGESLEQIFKRIGVRYAMWYNYKYNRVGHLFQDRFRSEVVEDDGYFFTVLRYIHQNPVKAGLCDRPELYRWSSYPAYFGEESLCNVAEVLDMLHTDRERGADQLRQLHCQVVEMACMDIDPVRRRLSDAEAKAQLMVMCDVAVVADLQRVNTEIRDRTIVALKKNGASLRQIVRLTGWTMGIVRSR